MDEKKRTSSKKAEPDEKRKTSESEVPVLNDKEQAEGKKHIKFTSSTGNDENEKTSRRGKRSKAPKHNREIQAFRRETMEEIRKFRAARKEWLMSVDNTEVKTNAVENTLQAPPIDKRRINIMKKLGVKTSMIRPHRKTLRPRIYFTFKKSLTQQDRDRAEALVEVRVTKQNEKIKTTLKKDFSKLTRQASARLIKESKASLRAAKQKAKKSHSKSSVGKAPPSKAIEIIPLMRRQTDSKGDKSGKKRKTKDGFLSKGYKIKEDGAIEVDSHEEFDSLIKQLQSRPKYSTKALTDEDVNELRNLWRQFRPQLVVEKNAPKAKTAKKVPGTKKTHAKRNPRVGFDWIKKKLSLPTKPGAKTCSCKFVQGDGVVLLKKGCGCCAKLPAEKTFAVGSKSLGEIASDSQPEEPNPARHSFSTSKIVDSLEIIRKKLSSRSLAHPDEEENTNTEVFNRVGTVDESAPEDFRFEPLVEGPKSFMPVTSRTASRKNKDDGRDLKPILGRKAKKLVRAAPHVNFAENQQKSNDQENKM